MAPPPTRTSRTALLAALLPMLAACDRGPTRPIVPDAVRLTAIADTVAAGDSAALTALYEVHGEVLPSDEGLRWRSTRPDYFSIDSLTGRGQAHWALSYGAVPVEVIAEAGGVSDTTVVLVIPPVTGVVVGVSASVAVGRSFSAYVMAKGGVRSAIDFYDPPPEAGPIILRSSDPAVVSVASDGRLAARAAGAAWIVATLHGVSDSAQVRVGPGYPLVFLAATEGLFIRGVNDAGQVAATEPTPVGFGRGLIVSQQGQSDLGSCLPTGINNSGQVVCVSGQVYSNGAFADPPSGVTAASAITESGSVFGVQRALVNFSSGPATVDRPALWTGTIVTGLGGEECCRALLGTGKVNSLGLGTVRFLNGLYAQPGLVQKGKTIGLGAGGRYGVAYGINDAGDAVGSSEHQAGPGTAVIWRASEQWGVRFLGPRTTAAKGIAENGLVTGDSRDGAFVWKDDRYALLGDLVADDGWTISSAVAVSRNGLIAAIGQHTSGKRGIVLITPTAAP